MPNEHSYRYRAIVVSVYDGDTITVDIDLGFHLTLKTSVRLARINAPELSGVERMQGIVARDYLRSVLPKGAAVLLQTYKSGTEKYGRYLADVWIDDINLNDRLVELHLATRRNSNE